MLLGMTHEEAVVDLARSEVNSYKQMPFMLYQIQTKYRDEARPRAGLIRVREFTMKDAYSFHVSEDCLKRYYERAHAAYVRIFQRIGMKTVVSIESDTGMMGGAVSHEFMALADCGEDTVFLSPDGQYQANKEVARTALQFVKQPLEALTKVHTPGKKTIEEVAGFLGVAPLQTGKAVFYSDEEGRLLFVMIRGDLEVNETKLRNRLKIRELKFATDEQILAAGATPGYASPLGLDPKRVRILLDPSAAQSSNLVVGANEAEYHYTGFNFERDLSASARAQIEITDLASAREGDPCPITGQPLKMARGIEVGNIFQLGTKYSEAMNSTFLDQNGKAKPMIMGCYGIGVGRSMASVIEQSHDQYGPIWPLAIAPYQVHLCALNFNQEPVREAAEGLYQELLRLGIEVLFDDRNEKAGSAFNDADLIGIPFRVILSPKTLADQTVELKTRDKTLQESCGLGEVATRLQKLIREA
jgi:prolyl-tRNA synthetase